MTTYNEHADEHHGDIRNAPSVAAQEDLGSVALTRDTVEGTRADKQAAVARRPCRSQHYSVDDMWHDLDASQVRRNN